MQVLFVFKIVVLALLLINCSGEKSVATEYKAGLASKGEGDATPKNEPKTDEDKDEDEDEDKTDDKDAPKDGPTDKPKDDMKMPPPAGGDAAKGAKLLAACADCHNDKGPAKAVILNAAVIPRLKEVTGSGRAAGFHSAVAEQLNPANRPDLEAGLKAK